jgi:hypothetical protein
MDVYGTGSILFVATQARFHKGASSLYQFDALLVLSLYRRL